MGRKSHTWAPLRWRGIFVLTLKTREGSWDHGMNVQYYMRPPLTIPGNRRIETTGSISMDTTSEVETCPVLRRRKK